MFKTLVFQKKNWCLPFVGGGVGVGWGVGVDVVVDMWVVSEGRLSLIAFP